ncbi:putative ATP-dependent DNA helicase Srs2p [[Candida] railenensis]|uniref:DNA 3'-5' helicase n=1 Tax=[Candida] railenensis TaxID=45579 RepID=A0A9P0VWD5_9ASCO|nr:putative ATP-dependent DNA helicase Srs2p [[Candida] railenensis]
MFLDGLNFNQRKAVVSPPNGRLQIIAGPGTGKTKVLISRVAYLILDCNIPPNQIIVTTFTKKAANEMVERLSKLLEKEKHSVDISKLIIGTFHSICFRIIMTYGKLINKQSFKIADERDSNHILGETLDGVHASDFDRKEVDIYKKGSSSNIDTSSYDSKKIKRQISKLKSAGIEPEAYRQLNSGTKKFNRFIYTVYVDYQDRLERNMLLDFDDCLLSCNSLLKQHPVLNFIKHVLVDEFQDTNEIQLQLMYEFTKHSNNVTIVGDPDQSIYGFRDAQVINFDKMKTHYLANKVDIVSLDENYRSTANILEVSELVMRQQVDSTRHRKDLKSQHTFTFAPMYCNLASQEEEAEWICFQLEQLTRKLPNTPFQNKDVAILFRSSFQTRIVENELVKRKIPYFMLRGKAFWDRKEVVSILDYIRVVSSENDRIAYLRTINFPKRGLGLRSIEEIEKYLNEMSGKSDESVFTHLQNISEGDTSCALTKSNLENLGKYLSSISKCRQQLNDDLDMENLFQSIYVESGLKDEFSNDPNYELNIFEVKRQLAEHVPVVDRLPLDDEMSENDDEVQKNILQSFVQSIGLYESNQDEDSNEERENGGKVILSTIHGSKGLEWPVVFVPGLSEGIIPAKFAMDNGGTEDEERRCFYVATTRAKHLLYVSSFTEERERWGRLPINETSRFLKGLKGKLSNNKQAAFNNLNSLQDLYKLVGKDWISDNYDFDKFIAECHWYNKDDDKLKVASNFAHSTFGSANLVSSPNFSNKKVKGEKLEVKIQNRTIQSMLSSKSSEMMNRRSMLTGYSSSKSKSAKLTSDRSIPSKNLSKITKVPVVAAVMPVMGTSSKAPPYIPSRKVPGSLSRLKKLHEVKK